MNLLHNQRGALFGVDARIGLVVFAALSVVAGFYGFSRVKMAKEAALLRDLAAIEEALAGYQTDMNTFFLFTLNKDFYGFEQEEEVNTDLAALWDKNKVKPNFQHLWNGPYLQRETPQHKTYGRYSISYGQEVREDYCTTTSSCYVWLSLSDVPAKIWTEVNRYLDEGGSIREELPTISGRVQADGTEDTRTLYLRTIERKVN